MHAARSVIGPLLAGATVATMLAVLPGSLAGAAVTPACNHTRLTDSPGNVTAFTDTTISGDGSTVAFTVNGPLGALNPEGNTEVLVFDLATNTLSAVTQLPGSASSGRADLSHDGRTITLISTGNLANNADVNGDVFRGVRTGAGGAWTFTNITSSTGAGVLANQRPRISADGRTIAFVSKTDLVNNDDLNEEIYRWNLGSMFATTQQITDTTGAVQAGDVGISGDGRTIGFSSTANLDGENADLGRELYRWRSGLGIDQLTDEDGDSEFTAVPRPDHDGDRIAYQTNEDYGENGDGSYEVLRAQLPPSPQVLTAVTSGPAGTASQAPATNSFGSRIAFESNAAIGGSTDGSLRPFFWSQLTGPVRLIPSTTGNTYPDISAIGSRLSYIGPDAGDGSKDVFLATCRTFSDVGTGHLFWDDIEWMAAAEVSTGFPDGTYRPAGNVTRAAMAAFMYRLAGQPAFTPPGVPTFTDVAVDHVFFAEIEWLVEEEIATGFPGHLFKPVDPVTRQAMSAFMYRLAGEPLGPFPDPGFADVSPTSAFFTEISWMAHEGITTGFPGNLFKPSQDVTRQAMSAFMRRLAEGPGVDV